MSPEVVTLDPRDDEQVRACRVRHAVVDVRASDEASVQLIATADAGRWLADRFLNSEGEGGLDQQGQPKVDLRSVASRVELTPCGSSLEADLRWLDAYRGSNPRHEPPDLPRLIYLARREEQGVARLSPVDLTREEAAGPAVGPFPSSAAARRYAALGVRTLGICEHPSMLEAGSYELAAYDAGLDEWLRWRGGDLDRRLAELRGDMSHAAASQDFEAAAELKSRIEEIEATPCRDALDSPERFRWLIVAPSPEKARVRPMVVTPSGWGSLPDRSADETDHTLVFEGDALDSELSRNAGDPAVTAMAAARLLRPTKPVTWFRLGEMIDENELIEAARRAAGLKPAKDPPS